ncbi:hypothetical protein [Fibrobacter sp.]|nr:hypothetical protein [Fibrobacter sp.]
MEKQKKEYEIPEIKIVKLERQTNLLESSPVPDNIPVNFNEGND